MKDSIIALAALLLTCAEGKEENAVEPSGRGHHHHHNHNALFSKFFFNFFGFSKLSLYDTQNFVRTFSKPFHDIVKKLCKVFVMGRCCFVFYLFRSQSCFNKFSVDFIMCSYCVQSDIRLYERFKNVRVISVAFFL